MVRSVVPALRMLQIVSRCPPLGCRFSAPPSTRQCIVPGPPSSKQLPKLAAYGMCTLLGGRWGSGGGEFCLLHVNKEEGRVRFGKGEGGGNRSRCGGAEVIE